MAERPDFYRLQQALRQADAELVAAEAHGVLCGMYCASGNVALEAWLRQVFEALDFDNASIREACQLLVGLHDNTKQQLNDAEAVFELLLPDDESSLVERTEALAEWCHGFVFGLAAGGLKRIVQEAAEVFRTRVSTLQAAGSRPPFFMHHGDFTGGGFYGRSIAEGLGPEQPFFVLHPHGLDGRPVPSSIEAMAVDHLEAVRAAQPHGPYFLGGHCNGGLIAFEMARRLRQAGESVALLVVMDASAGPRRFRFLHGLSDVLGALRGLDPDQRRDAFLRARRGLLSSAEAGVAAAVRHAGRLVRSGKGAKLVCVDPRFTKSAAKAHIYAPLRSGTDIAFLGGMIKYILENSLIQKEYVVEYTNASFLIDEKYGFQDGLFSGYDAKGRRY